MVDPWMTPEGVLQGMRRSGIYLTRADAEAILAQLDQPGAYAKHEGRVVVEVWDGKPVNGIDMRNHEGRPSPPKPVLLDGQPHELRELPREELKPKNTSHQFLTKHQGLAFVTKVDGKIIGFQPHVGGIPGWHALTSSKVPCDCGKLHDTCPTCKQAHDIEAEMEKQRVSIVQGLAGAELQTRVLYLAQEMFDRRMQALDRLAQQG